MGFFRNASRPGGLSYGAEHQDQEDFFSRRDILVPICFFGRRDILVPI